MKSSYQFSFAQVPKVDIPRSVFDRSHTHKTTFEEDRLVPFYIDEALPGDTFNLKANLFCRLATPIVPIMDNLHMDTFYFAVPCRLLWDNWEKFNGAQDAPLDSTDFNTPIMDFTGYSLTVGSLYDYMGLPIVAGLDHTDINALPFRAYNLIYNEWFRDQNLIQKATIQKDNGPDPADHYSVRKRAKRHDYFTSALPWPQKGPGVLLPLGTSAPIEGTGKTLGLTANNTDLVGMHSTATFLEMNYGLNNVNLGTAAGSAYGASGGIGIPTDHTKSGMIADLANAIGPTINSFREAFQLQRLYERDARGGTRYTEIIRSHFGVISPDSRMQRPEYLGGSSTRINIHPVQQTSSTDATTPQGNLAAFGLGNDSNGGFTKSFTEHCYIIGLVCVRGDVTYQQGVPRMFSRRTRWDYYWPALAHLGEQAIKNKEIYCQNDSTGDNHDNEVFGYQERFAEYRYYPNKITGTFRSDLPAPIDVWHLAQEFGSLPELNDTFIESETPIARVVAVPSEPHFLFDSLIELKCARPMPVYAVPGLIDHF